MTLPNFLGIGVPRGGSTWLHALLATHPDVYMPTRRKEVRFFDRDYGRGLDWYASFFPNDEEAERYRAIGEISPQYYKCAACAERIFQTLPRGKLIIILRHPINRAYSVYGFHLQRRNFKGSFDDFLTQRPQILEQGYYSRYLDQYMRYFDRDQLLVLLFENAVADLDATKAEIGEFLGVDPRQFPPAAGSEKVNASTLPKYRFAYKIATLVGQRLNRWHMDGVVDLVRRLQIERLLAQGRSMPPLDPEVKARRSALYAEDFDRLERVYHVDLSRWRGRPRDAQPGPARLSFTESERA